jgi:phage minor structural protein, N-terminal domain protein
LLYLLNKDVRAVRWNGEPLHEATSAIVKETMNGDFTLTVKYPISDSGIYQLIQEDMLIKAPTPVLGAQLFRIKKPVEHNDHLEITAYHISDDVMQRSITPVSVTSQSCSMALSRMVQNTKTALGDFSFNSDIQDRRTFNTTETETLYSVLLDGKHSIVGTWEGELVRDNFAMTVKKSRGENRGVVITTHKNLKDYQRTRNSQNVVTRIHAKSTFKPEGAEKETTIRVTVDSPLINSYPYINEKEYENNNAKSVEELQKWAQAKFSNEGIDKVSDAIKIEAYELDGQVVHMGDTVNLKSRKHNVDSLKKAIAYEFDALKEEYISLTFDDKAGTGGSRASGGLSSAADAILGVTGTAQEIALEKALQNADLDFEHKVGLLRQEIADGIELAKARAEEVKRKLSDTIDQRFSSFDNGPLQEVKRRADDALKNAGAGSLLAQEAKQISEQVRRQLDSKADLVEFQRVKETNLLYERIIGRSESDIAEKVARMALTNQLFQVEVAKNVGDSRNYVKNADFRDGSKNWKESNISGLNFNYEHSTKNRGKTGVHIYGTSINARYFGLQQTFKIELKKSDKITLSFLVSKDGYNTFSGLDVGLHYRKDGAIKSQAWREISNSDITASTYKKLSFNYELPVDIDEINLMFYGNPGKSINLYISEIKLETGSDATPFTLAPEDTDEAIRTVQNQLAGSWSVQNINSAGDLISGLNLGANGHNRLDGKLTHITGETLIDSAVIKSAMIDKLKTANFEAGSVTTVVLDAEAVTAEKIKVDQAFFNKLVANEVYLSQLFAKQAFINRVQSVEINASQVRSGILSGDRIYGGTIRGANIFGGTLTGHTKIQLGSYGSFDTVNGGLQINVPRDYNSKDGLGVQFIGSNGRGEDVPYGLFIYKDSDFTTGGYANKSDDFLLTVAGYIKAKGIGWMRTEKGNVGNKPTATIGFWNSDNVSLSFGGSGNDIYYSFNGTAYSLWAIVNKYFSDRRLKENIIDCQHKALDYIHQFKFKEYDWKKQEDRPQQAHTKIGLIAQEVQAVDPTLVYENGDTLNLDNLRLTNIALKAIQELALENKTLTQRLENLENERRTT